VLIAGIVAALRAISLASKLLLALYMGRYLGASALGVYGLFAATSGFALTLVGLEYHQHAIRELVQSPERRGSIVLSQFRLYALSYALAPLVIVPLFMLSGMPHFCAYYLAIILPAAHISLECQRLLTALSRPIAAYVLNALANGFWVLPVLVLGFLRPGSVSVQTILAAWAAGAVSAALLGLTLLARLRILQGWRWSDSAPRWLGVRTGLLFLATSLCLLAIDSVDRYTLQLLASTRDVGIYTFHANIARAHRDILFVMMVVPAMPALVEATGPNAHDRQQLAKRLAIASAALAVAMTALIYVALALANRPELSENVASFYWLLAGSVVTGLSTSAHYRLYAARQDRAILRAHGLGLTVSVALTWACVRSWGIQGAAIANCLALGSIALSKYRACARLSATQLRPSSVSA
jgi:O-antigen/teichoic acid export membrane protein